MACAIRIICIGINEWRRRYVQRRIWWWWRRTRHTRTDEQKRRDYSFDHDIHIDCGLLSAILTENINGRFNAVNSVLPIAAVGRFEPVAGSVLPAPVDADDEADD
jgi:hypothetical protein